MVFKMVTLDLTQDLEDDFGPPPESPSPSTTLCCTATFAIAASTTLELARTYRRRGRPNNGIEYGDATELVQPGNLTVFTFKELQVATNTFSEENMIGRGGFGRVYKGTLANGYVVAVKRCGYELNECINRVSAFQAEVKVGNMSNHRNVAPLLGFYTCPKPKEFFLVYPYMVNRSLAYCLHDKQSPESLKWQTRMKIALGVARGIAHLHSLNIIHRDIKPANILLDERFNPLVTDFGIALFLDEHHNPKQDALGDAFVLEAYDPEIEFTTLCGTYGYIAPEYILNGHCSKKIDVYGFGVTLLELISGKKFPRVPFSDTIMYLNFVKRFLKVGRMEKLIDENMEGNYEVIEVERLVTIALLCVQQDPRERPNMLQVVQFLQGNGVPDKVDEIVRVYTELHTDVLAYTIQDVHTDDSDSNLTSEELSGPR